MKVTATPFLTVKFFGPKAKFLISTETFHGALFSSISCEGETSCEGEISSEGEISCEGEISSEGETETSVEDGCSSTVCVDTEVSVCLSCCPANKTTPPTIITMRTAAIIKFLDNLYHPPLETVGERM